jgi:CBS domain-containing protein
VGVTEKETDMSADKPRVRDFCRTEVVTVRPDSAIMQAVRLMLKHDISGMPVVDDRGRLVGMLTERDCIRKAVEAGYLDEPGGSVAEFMSADVQTVGPDDPLMDVAQRFIDSPFRRFPVVEHGKLLGIIGRRDLLRAMNPRPRRWPFA